MLLYFSLMYMLATMLRGDDEHWSNPTLVCIKGITNITVWNSKVSDAILATFLCLSLLPHKDQGHNKVRGLYINVAVIMLLKYSGCSCISQPILRKILSIINFTRVNIQRDAIITLTYKFCVMSNQIKKWFNKKMEWEQLQKIYIFSMKLWNVKLFREKILCYMFLYIFSWSYFRF